MKCDRITSELLTPTQHISGGARKLLPPRRRRKAAPAFAGAGVSVARSCDEIEIYPPSPRKSRVGIVGAAAVNKIVIGDGRKKRWSMNAITPWDVRADGGKELGAGREV